MVTTLSDAQLLARRYHRRRWIIPLSLAMIPLLLALIVVALLLSSSGITIEEATAIYERMDKKSTRAQVERQLGRPFSQRTLEGNKTYTWLFVRQSLNSVEFFAVLLYTQNEEKDCQLSFVDGTVQGWVAWRFRWALLKQRLGINVDDE
ncbi:MAG: hypothetical protein QM703_16650 [Gemmatales bacterium]